MPNSKSQFSSSFRQKILILISLGIGFSLAQVTEYFSKDGTFVFGNFVQKKSNFALQRNDSLLAHLEVDSDTECQELCTTNPRCLSVNYGEDPSNVGKVQCEMFGYGRTDFQEHFVSKTGFTHLRLKTACTNNPCYSGVVCNPVLGNPARDYSCICPHSDNTNVQNCDSGDVKCNALGMEALTILDSQITASSEHVSGTHPRTHARVNYAGSWVPNSAVDAWIMIDLLKSTTILAVATQGRHDSAEYVSTYEVYYRMDYLAPFTAYQEDGVVKTLIGNSNGVDVVRHELKVPFVAKAVRFLPKTWTHTGFGWRLELYGCYN
ncbi:uncharacterized protein LOC116298903 [Actinia tenebrosa]|uniref:Uncharacterized protein LOC116298903 n=1 Tax=Actinia tenebrosa TaxID=6105 RepID=A0A6P8I454_ACTTE|nr:uncharacterized protein LOC116298903 [Actinia tenebrosa]